MKNSIRIGCAAGFYGDSNLAARQLVEKGDIDYLVFDYLAEVTMSILARQKAQDSEKGYAIYFVTRTMRDVMADCAKKGIKVVANAGGVNVPACIKALQTLNDQQGLNLKIAGVYGDDLTETRSELSDDDLKEFQTGKALPEKLASINSYLGARPIADALAAGADIVVTGRVVDSAVTLGPLMHEFDWQESDFNKLAQGSLAGHIIECGAQCTGGNHTDWQDVPDFYNIGYPIAEVYQDGKIEIGKPEGTGGLVNPATVAEQIIYEIGDPANYLLPDVNCDFSSVKLDMVGENRVQVTGALGRASGSQYKVCATYIDGYRLFLSFNIGGMDAKAKAESNINAWLTRTRNVFKKMGLPDYRQVSVEILGTEATYGPHSAIHDSREVCAKVAVHHDSKEILAMAGAEYIYLGTSGAPGMFGVPGMGAKPQPLIRVHSARVDKSEVSVRVQLGENLMIDQPYCSSESSEPFAKVKMQVNPVQSSGNDIEIPLIKLAYARSGDKGDNANVGVIARKPEYFPYIYQQLTADVVERYFEHLVEGEVERFEMPGLMALNFFMTEALGGGGTASLRADTQAKAFGQMLLSIKIRVPDSISL